MSLDQHFEEPTAIRTNLGAIFVSLELSRSTWLITSVSPGGGEKMSKHGVSGAHHKTGARRGVVGYGRADDRSRPETAAIEDAAAGCSSRSLAPGQAGR